MRIAFSAKKSGSELQMDERFARADWFLIYDTENEAFEEIDNTSIKNAAQGAGIQAAELLIRKDVNVVVTGKCGPKALDALRSVDIPVHSTNKQRVYDALNELLLAYGEK